MSDEKSKTLSEYRLERAHECLADAALLLKNNSFNSSVTRSYYAIFNSLRAILALEGVDFKKHSAVISYFQKEYVRTGAFSNEISDYIRVAFSARNDSDYQDFYSVLEEDAKIQFNNANIVIEAVKKYLSLGDK
jgi:uncharacterized protein (UPF0332 family)